MSTASRLAKLAEGLDSNGVLSADKGGTGATSLAAVVTSATPAGVSDQVNTSTGYFDLPVGTTTQRPASANTGMVRYNSTLSIVETYNGTSWTGLGGGAATVSATAPASPTEGAFWLNSETGDLHTYGSGGWIVVGGGFSGSYSDLTNKPSLATVATTGSYSDLTNKPTSTTPATVSDQANTSTGYFGVPVGTTAQRPVTGVTGATRINTTTNYLEVYYNGSWLQVASIGLGSSSSNPATSAAQLRTNGITTDGVYWFSTAQVVTPFQAYVKFNYIDGGDWYLLLKVYNQGDMSSGSTYWTNNTTWNSSDFNLATGTWAKYQTWNAFGFTRVMMQMTQAGVTKIPPIMIWNNSITNFATAITTAGTVVSTATPQGLRCDSTDPAIAVSATVGNVAMKSGTAFTSTPSVEPIIQHYGISCWAGNASNSTTAETFSSVARAGAWIGSPLDEGGHTFNALASYGADSGFGFGCGAGNVAKTTSAGWGDWTASASINALPGYVWIR